MTVSQLPGNVVLVGYLFVFGIAAVVSFASIRQTQYIEDVDTRRGLMALLATSGLWAVLHIGYLAAPSVRLQYGFYIAGLVVGLATVGPWLYFCSAYTGRSYHNNRTVRRLAVGSYLTIVAVKVTNPIHQQYFTAEVATTPFTYLVIHHEPLHWIVMGLAYSLAFVGIFMLFELFVQVDFDTKPLIAVVSLTGLPVLLDVVGAATPLLLDVTYSALGVAAFAVGVLYVYFDRFQTVQLAGEVDDPIIVLDGEGHVQDFNRSARALFPALADAIGTPFDDVLPSIASAVDTDGDDVRTFQIDGDTRYYSVSENPFTAVGERLGRSIILTDVTERERYRRELERQNDRLDRFASIVSHDLRNPLNIAQGRIDLALETDGDDEGLAAAKRALDRMEALIEDVLRLARLGQPIDETERVTVGDVATDAWEMVETEAASLVVEGDGDCSIEADPLRLQQLFENLFRNSLEHGGSDVIVTLGPLDDASGFFVADDGAGIPEDVRDRLFEFGFTTSESGTGFGLAIVEEVVNAHGWSIRATDAEGGGARFEIRTKR
ncbi:ATP-binding protein [Halorubrum sp. DTA98]|uniref:sensor histidine kinase n=1 Tax=Halorubrum sp. DTA98 TaxID=3402163 RepID=UPI003AAC0725